MVEARRRVLEEWHAWRADVEAEAAEEREVLGLPEDPHAALLEAKTKEMEGDGGNVESDRVIEEIVEDVLVKKGVVSP